MDNPFLKRVTERLRDEEAFLGVVSPEPVTTFLSGYGPTGQLYEPLVLIRGAPGSGKTTLARLFEFPTIAALLRNRSLAAHKALLAALTECGAIQDEIPQVVGCRLPLESDYRDLWEFPYPEELRTSLLTTLVQARAVLGLLRNLRAAGVEADRVEVVPRPDAAASVETIGGTRGADVLARAREVELALYSVARALIAPSLDDLRPPVTGAYRPFDVIEHLKVSIDLEGVPRELVLRPLIILDDAHALHPHQFSRLRRWLAGRELRVARWMLTRLDILTPREVLEARTDTHGAYGELPGIMAARDTLEIWLQSSLQDRREHRSAFRHMAKDMAARYLRQMPLFASRSLHRLDDLLSTEEPPFPAGKLRELTTAVDAAQKRLKVPPSRRATLEQEVERYAASARSVRVPPEIRLAMVAILIHRYANRIPQDTLFGPEEDPEPTKPLAAKRPVYEGARVHLLHNYDRPLYYGIDTLCDASSENAEQFLRLASLLVEASATQVTRSKRPTLDSVSQHKLLRERASDLLQQWSFPYQDRVRVLTEEVAQRCLTASLTPNARLGAGANAYGILADDFRRIPRDSPDLARVLQFGIAYNALTLVPNYTCKDQQWYLLELGGLVILSHGLTLQRGGFLEGSVEDLEGIIGSSDRTSAQVVNRR